MDNHSLSFPNPFLNLPHASGAQCGLARHQNSVLKRNGPAKGPSLSTQWPNQSCQGSRFQVASIRRKRDRLNRDCLQGCVIVYLTTASKSCQVVECVFLYMYSSPTSGIQGHSPLILHFYLLTTKLMTRIAWWFLCVLHLSIFRMLFN